WMALGFAVYLALLRALQLRPAALCGGGGPFVPLTGLALVAGSAVTQMCAATISAAGLGNGSSLVICANIMSDYASTLHTVASALSARLLSPLTLLAVLGGYLGLVAACTALTAAELRLPLVHYAASAPPPPHGDGGGGGGGGMQDLIAQARLLSQRKSSERMRQRGGAGAGGGAAAAAAGGGGSGSPAAAAAAAASSSGSH
ncbi:hypothetical protein Agub_g6935, partial [Astrephomene gubernaculifera]